MGEYRHLKNLDQIIGMQCTYKFDKESNVWNDHNTVRCKVVNYQIELMRSFPYSLTITLNLEVLENDKIDTDTSDDLYNIGVGLAHVVFD